MSQQFGTYDLVLRSGVDPTTGGVAVCGFTTAGMVGVIATSHIIESLGLTQLGTVMDERFPAVALIQNEVPRHPVRVYQGNGIGVFTAEIQFEKEQDIAFGSTVLEWFTAGGFEQLIIIDGILKPEKEVQGEGLFAVGASEKARKRLKEMDLQTIQRGIVSGITGFLLSEGDRLNLDITALLSEASPMYPDVRAAAVAIEAITEMTGVDIPLSKMLESAREIEHSVQEIIQNSTPLLPSPSDDDVENDPSFG
ncbi:MAG: proteasome assembly chaperone family protein [Candidatus Poseidoniaceae archaeon]